MASRPAPRPKSSKKSSRPSGSHSVQGGRDYRRVTESKKWNKGT